MWPYADNENDWLSSESKAGSLPNSTELTNDQLAYYVRKGRALRAYYFRESMTGLVAAVSRFILGPKQKRDTEVRTDRLGEDLRTPLTSIRSFSEILRSYPDLTQQQRSRYLDLIIEESRRLERVICGYESKTS